MKKILLLFFVGFLLTGCVQSKCKTPWWKKQPNKHYQKEQKDMSKKYKSHKRSERKKHKCIK